jgi:hypothetical protein
MLRPPPVVSLPDRPECDTSGHPGRLQRQNGPGDGPENLSKPVFAAAIEKAG